MPHLTRERRTSAAEPRSEHQLEPSTRSSAARAADREPGPCSSNGACRMATTIVASSHTEVMTLPASLRRNLRRGTPRQPEAVVRSSSPTRASVPSGSSRPLEGEERPAHHQPRVAATAERDRADWPSSRWPEAGREACQEITPTAKRRLRTASTPRTCASRVAAPMTRYESLHMPPLPTHSAQLDAPLHLSARTVASRFRWQRRTNRDRCDDGKARARHVSRPAWARMGIRGDHRRLRSAAAFRRLRWNGRRVHDQRNHQLREERFDEPPGA